MRKKTKIVLAVCCGFFLIACVIGVVLLKKISAAGGIRYCKA